MCLSVPSDTELHWSLPATPGKLVLSQLVWSVCWIYADLGHCLRSAPYQFLSDSFLCATDLCQCLSPVWSWRSILLSLYFHGAQRCKQSLRLRFYRCSITMPLLPSSLVWVAKDIWGTETYCVETTLEGEQESSLLIQSHHSTREKGKVPELWGVAASGIARKRSRNQTSTVSCSQLVGPAQHKH